MAILIMSCNEDWYDNTKAKFGKGNFNRNHNKVMKGDSLLIYWLILKRKKKKRMNFLHVIPYECYFSM